MEVKDESSRSQKRVMLWNSPRCLSVALFRALTASPKVKPLFELYSQSYFLGEDRVSPRYEQREPRAGVSFRETKEAYEADYEGYDAILAKDPPYTLMGKLSDCTWIPRGYQHTFIIRNPQKSVVSLYKATTEEQGAGCSGLFDASEVGFKEQVQLFRLVTEELKQPAVVLDADDLLDNPEGALKEYCRRTGLDFCPEMLDWTLSPVDPCSYLDSFWYSWYEQAITNTGFTKPSGKKAPPTTLPLEVQEAIDENMPYYKELYQHRITV